MRRFTLAAVLFALVAPATLTAQEVAPAIFIPS